MAEVTKVWTEIRPNGLTPKLNECLLSFRAQRKFNPKEWVVHKAGLLNDYMRKAGLKACTVSVSGGVDSAVIYGLCVIASKQPGSPIQRVVGVAQPIHSTASIWQRALELQPAFGGEVITVDQTALHSQLDSIVSGALGVVSKPFASGQLRSYMRTPVGYYVAQLLSQEGTPAIVMGTGNHDEDGYLMYARALSSDRTALTLASGTTARPAMAWSMCSLSPISTRVRFFSWRVRSVCRRRFCRRLPALTCGRGRQTKTSSACPMISWSYT